jgi:hypothetical protein
MIFHEGIFISFKKIRLLFLKGYIYSTFLLLIYILIWIKIENSIIILKNPHLKHRIFINFFINIYPKLKL